MPLPKSSVVVRFGKLDQHRSPKNTILGTLEQALNIRQRKLGSMDTRYGSSSLTLTPDSGSISSAVALGNNGGSIVLQTSDTVFLSDTTNSAFRNKGSHTTAMPGTQAISFVGRGRHPTHCIFGTQRWELAADVNSGGSALNHYYRVVDTATEVEILAPTDTGLVLKHAKAIATASNVWVFYYVANVLRVAKFSPTSPTTAPVVTNFYTPANPILAYDVFVPTGSSTVHVAMVGANVVGSGEDVVIKQLDTATGLPTATAGAYSEGGTVSVCGWVHGTGGSGSIYLAVKDGNDVELKQINETTLALTSTTAVATLANCKGLTGYTSGGKNIVFTTEHGSTDYANAFVTRYNVTDTTSTVFARAAWMASNPFQVNSTWYVVTGHDDIDDAAVGDYPQNLQRAYYLRSASSTSYTNILARALYGEGGDTWNGSYANAGGVSGLEYGFRAMVSVSGNKATMLLNGQTGATGSYDYSTYHVVWDIGTTLGSVLANLDEAETLFPGGWAKRLISESLLTDMVPMMYPTQVTGSATAGGALAAGVYGFAVIYKITDPRGNIARSAPGTCTVTTAGGNLVAAIVIPTLRTLSTNLSVTIEVYATSLGGTTQQLIDSFDNDPTADTITKSYAAAPQYGETLYTGGGVLPNYPVPPCRAAFPWNDRLWLVGTEFESEAWHSKQFASGISPEFAPPLKVTCYGGSGSLRAGGVISSDYAVLFKRDAVFVVTGAGPDDTGAGGSFQVRRLNWDGGCDNHASVINYPGGVLFQGLDGLIYRVTSGLSVDDPGADAQDYASATVYRAVHVPKAREVRFYLSTGKVLVLDYGMANENAPNGYWYLDQSNTWSCGAGGGVVIDDVPYFVDSTGTVWKEVSGQYFDGSSTPILPKCDVNTLQLGDLGGEFRVSRVFFYGQWHSLHDLRVSIGADDGTAVNYDESAISGSPEVFVVRPSGCGRIAALDISVERTGSGTGQGFSFDGLVIEVQPKGRAKRLNSGQRI